jgi:predicted phosphate transport protein (TIGR00153 family)
LWRTDKRLQEKLEAYLAQVMSSLGRLKEAFPRGLDGTFARQTALENPVHEMESVADDMRRDLELELYSGKLLPESRADMLTLVEAVDRISNVAESIVEFFSIQKLDVPAELHEDIHDLLLKSLETCAAMSETVRLLLDDLSKIRGCAEEVDQLESQCDTRERRLVRRLFELDLELARKLHVRDLVSCIASLADQAENVADMVERMAVKRRL